MSEQDLHAPRGGRTRVAPSMWSEIQDLVHRAPVMVSDTDSLPRVARTLWAENVGLALVQDATGHIVGLLSERDLVGAIALGIKETATAADVMVVPLIVVRPSDTLYDAAAAMLDCGIRHMPVADDQGHYSGVVSIRDVLRPLLIESFGG